MRPGADGTRGRCASPLPSGASRTRPHPGDSTASATRPPIAATAETSPSQAGTDPAAPEPVATAVDRSPPYRIDRDGETVARAPRRPHPPDAGLSDVRRSTATRSPRSTSTARPAVRRRLGRPAATTSRADGDLVSPVHDSTVGHDASVTVDPCAEAIERRVGTCDASSDSASGEASAANDVGAATHSAGVHLVARHPHRLAVRHLPTRATWLPRADQTVPDQSLLRPCRPDGAAGRADSTRAASPACDSSHATAGSTPSGDCARTGPQQHLPPGGLAASRSPATDDLGQRDDHDR